MGGDPGPKVFEVTSGETIVETIDRKPTSVLGVPVQPERRRRLGM